MITDSKDDFFAAARSSNALFGGSLMDDELLDISENLLIVTFQAPNSI